MEPSGSLWDSLEINGVQWALVGLSGGSVDSVGFSGGKRAMHMYQGLHFKGRYNFTTKETANSSLISLIKFY